MDDWQPVAFGQGPLGWYFRAQVEAGFRKLASRANVRMGICEAMCDEYEQRYGGKWFPFHNPVDLNSYRKATRRNWTAGKPFKVRYGGKTGWGVRQSLIELARSISDLRKAGLDITLEIRTGQSEIPALAEMQSLDGSVVLPLEPYESLPQSLASADLLAIVYDWEEKRQAYSRLSMPTKAAEYMASATPILVYGPKGHAVIEYARKNGWGYVVSDCDPVTLKAALRELATDQSLRERLGRSAVEVTTQNHESQRIRSRFQDTLAMSLQLSPLVEPSD
jgi:glycosyltransferase involved in cell wall biosynthesis